MEIEQYNQIGSKKSSFFKNAIDIIFSPNKAFKNIIVNPKILLPLLIVMFSANISNIMQFDLYKNTTRETLETVYEERGIEVSEEQLEDILKISTMTGVIVGPIMACFVWLLYGLIIFGAFNFLNSKGTYKQYLSIMGYAQIILFLSALVGGLIAFLTGQLYFDTSLAILANLLIPVTKGSYIYGVLRGIDVFNIWYYILLFLGFSQLSGVGRKKTLAIVLIVCIGSILLGANALKAM